LALVNYFVQLGEAGKAERLLRSMDNALRRSPSAPFVQIAREQANAVLAHCLGEPERGAQSVATGLEIAQRCGIFLWNLPLCGAGCMFAFLTGDLVTAQRYVDQMLLQPLECVQTFRSWALCLESALAFETRDLPRALRAGEASLALTTREGPWPEALSRLDLAMTLHALGRDDEADAHLARLAAIAADMKSRQLEFDYLTLAALFAFDRHDDEEGSRQLRAAFELASAKAIMGWQVGVARDGLARLCAKALDAGIETDFVRRIIATRKLTPDATAANLESWPWPVRVYTFGRFALVKGRKPVAFRGKTQKRPLDLLKALIALGGREVSEARIIEALWPEAEGDAAYYALNMALKRLRELLGQPDAVLLTDRKLTLNPRICWVDAWAFERGLGQPATDHKTIETALGLCKGRFLGTDEAPWGISLRERLHAKFLSGVRSLGGKLEERHQWSEAVAWYQRALHVDDLVEEFYQRLMLCHDRLGQRGTALSTYQRCKRALATRLSVHPSAQTNEIYRRLASLEN
jgi:DNA-binding SARP family transcriptional activator